MTGKPRKLSRFLCREMLYDYLTGELNSERRAAVEEYLSSSNDERQELERLKSAIAYCDQLSATTVSHPLMEELANQQSPLVKSLNKVSWRNWPEFMRWGTEALLISLVVAVLAVIIPWDKIQDLFPQTKKPIVLAEIEKQNPKTEEETPPATAEDTKAEETTASETTVAEAEKAATAPKAPPSSSSTTEKESSEPPPVLMSKQRGEEDGEPVETKPKQKSKTAQVKVKEGAEEKALKGDLYRAFMTSDNLDAVTPLMRAEIEKLGGKKAGQVELGWRSKPNESYFHFSLPEKGYEELIKNLRYFGPVRIYKEAHWRVMPEGKIRIILIVEAADKDKK